MKNLLNNFIKLSILYSFLILTSCEKELYEAPIHENKSRTINLEQFKSETGLKNFNTNRKITPANETNKIISDINFNVDPDFIKAHLDDNNKETYTFKVYPINEIMKDKEYYNLIYEKYGNDWNEILLKIKEKEIAQQGEVKTDSIQMIYNKLDNTMLSKNCFGTTYIISCDGSCAAAGYSQCDGFACPTGECLLEVSYFGPCNTYDFTLPSPSFLSGPTVDGGGGISIFEPNPVDENCNGSITCSNYFQFVQFKLTLNDIERHFLENFPDLSNWIYQKLIKGHFSSNSVNSCKFLIKFKKEHPQCSLAQLDNWFPFEKSTLEFPLDQPDLDELDIDIPPQNLPSFSAFQAAFPSRDDPNYDTAEEIFSAIGGDVLELYNQGARNTCTIRISRALNYSGVTIPNIPGVTVKGADNKNYFTMVKNFAKWMKKTFGTPTGSNNIPGNLITENGEALPEMFHGKKGIYIMIVNSSYVEIFDATGHADIYNDDDCDGSCHFNVGSDIEVILFWELNN